MYFTELEKEIIQYRLDVPDAMAECLADTIDISYEQAFDLYEERLPGLIAKLTDNEPLDQWEVHAVRDIATDRTYADMAYEAVEGGEIWKKSKEEPLLLTMTPQWATRISQASENLHSKLETALLMQGATTGSQWELENWELEKRELEKC